MALGAVNFLISYTFLMLLLSNFSASNADEASISCLKSFKDSIQDPYNYLESWSFNRSICSFVGIDCWHPDDNKVFAIRLTDMGLTGQFPRGLEYCTSLTGLELSGNKLSGPVPVDICDKLKYITFLDLSSNQFSGTIPPEITRCRYLNILFLHNNHLHGPIPQGMSLLDRVKIFNVTNNALTGPVPHFPNAKFSAECYLNNEGLCGGPLKACEVSDLLSNGIITAFSMGWAFGFSLFVLGFFFGIPSVSVMTSMRKRNKGKGSEATEICKTRKIPRLEKFVTRINFTELSKATSNFSLDNIIGFGKAGILYKAFLPNGCSLSIKRLYASQNSEEKFISELLTLGTQRHENLLPLIGFCIEEEERFLVYKYMPNGNLYDCLHPTSGETGIIEWPLRMKIAFGIADGLSWLHHNCRVRIFHDNLNSRCILLDQNFVPNISNFWAAKLSNRETSNASSWSLFSSFQSFFQLNSDKKDVYCFGLLLLELMTGKEPSEMIHSADFQDTNSFMCSSSLCEVAFSSLQEQGFEETILQFYGVARDCLKSEEGQRPTMLEVCNRLKVIRLRHNNAYV
ncbi:hypothetical protein Pfo_026669 [Paulownia fortunei]|nr:hypothetical protein Pfo_026669 [Paulownia fortunei]